MMKVEQMINDNGNGAMNQFIISGDGKMIFQSYNSMIAEVDYKNNVITIGEDWDYSVTTGKHRNIFFRDYVGASELATKKGLQNAINNGKHGAFKIIMAS